MGLVNDDSEMAVLVLIADGIDDEGDEMSRSGLDVNGHSRMAPWVDSSHVKVSPINIQFCGHLRSDD